MDSYFLSEGRDLINNEFGSDYNTYYSILQLIASGLNHRSDIDGALQKDSGVYLLNLENNFGMASRIRPILASPNPIGSIDAVSGKHGSITVNGWAIDPDNGGATVEVHVYLFSSETETDLAKAVKTFENGQVVIIKNGIKYNAMGAQL